MNRGWVLSGVAVISAATGSFVTARVESARVFELNIYHTSPGKAHALAARFQDASRLLSRHRLDVRGYWVPEGDAVWNDTFIYLVAHSSRAEADRNWSAFHADPQFQKYVKAEDTEHLIQSVDTVYMRATAYSKLQ
jgi:hypothetical protein